MLFQTITNSGKSSAYITSIEEGWTVFYFLKKKAFNLHHLYQESEKQGKLSTVNLPGCPLRNLLCIISKGCKGRKTIQISSGENSRIGSILLWYFVWFRGLYPVI
jgi:hypothetical protein